MICPICGTENSNTAFCTNCGAKLVSNEVQNPTSAPTYVVPVTPAPQITKEQLPEQYKPLSPWAYFGLQILFAIPIVGFIFLIVFSCSRANINRRNLARSYWCSLIIVAVILVVYIVLMAAGVAAYNNYY